MISILKKTESTDGFLNLYSIEPKCWINLVNPTNAEIDEVSEKTDIPKDYLTAALDDNERPRFEVEDGMKLVIFRVLHEIPENGHFRAKTIPLGIIIKGSYIVTVCLFHTSVMRDFEEGKIKNFYTSKKTRFLIQILSRTNYYFLKYLDRIEREIDQIEKKLIRSLKNQEVFGLFELQKILIYFNSSIIANGIVLQNISKGKVVELFEEDQELLDDIIIENRQCLEMTSNYSNILSSTLDAYASVISNNLNDVMKFLTSLTIILSIPTIISSLYGMNVSLPFQEHPAAFWFTVLLSLSISALIAVAFMRKNWL